MNKAREPRVGIFWLYKTRLFFDSTPVSQGEACDGNVGHATAHIDYWTGLQERGVVPKEVEYEEASRGRIVFNVKTKQFTLMADKHILADSSVVKKILAELNLPRATKLDSDYHYRCAVCLYGMHDDDDDE